jgi:4'-phosphopantetheinyl transferase
LGKISNKFISDLKWEEEASAQCTVSKNEVHIWRLRISENLYRKNQLQTLLDEQELHRAGKYYHQKDRDRFVISRGVQRIILSRYQNALPKSLDFVLGDNKKPYLINNHGAHLHYNLSHSVDCILLAVANTPVGIDVEFIEENFPYNDILTDNFSQNEIAYISEGRSPERFFTLWTRKEALLKATGQGLGDHLQLTPALDGEYELDSLLTGFERDWQLNSFAAYPEYISAVAVCGTDCHYQFFDFV